jgi:predicted TIM-barrel fold metal-dependent hydrolase
LDYGPLMQLFAAQVPDAALRQTILWDNPKALFGF